MPKQNINQSDIVSFVKYLCKGIKKFGVVRIEEKMRELSEDSYDTQQKALRDKIFYEIYCQYRVSKNVVLKSSKRGVVTQAKVMAIILFSKHLEVSQREIASIFGRGQSLVSRRIKTFEIYMSDSVNEKPFEKIYEDKDFIVNYKKINETIIAFKQTLK